MIRRGGGAADRTAWLFRFVRIYKLDSIRPSRNNESGVAYAEPPWIVPGTILDGGKGTSVSGRRPGPFVSGVVAGGFRS